MVHPLNPLHPHKYYAGLSKRAATRRRKEILKFGAYDWRDPRAYTGFQTDVGRKTRRSSYTAVWQRRFPDAHSLADKAEATGVPESFLRESYNRGMAAWRTGHRPGATQQQWGYARVHSLLLCGKTAITTDSDIRRKAIRKSRKAARWFRSVKCVE